MRAILYRQGAGAELADVPKPRPGDGEALLAVEACGLCGTDLMKLASRPAHAVLGHEICGRIAQLGPGVRGFKEGERVVLAHHVPCGACHYCRRGCPSMCRQFKATNVSPGGFADFVLASKLHVDNVLLKVPESLDAVAASQTEPLACCLRNAKRLNLSEGDAAGIVGLGAVGLTTAQLLAGRGASVLGLDLEAARAGGLSPWGDGFTDAAAFEAALRERTSGRGLDALIFTAGTASMVSERLGWLRDGGALNVFASFHPPHASIDLNAIYHRELTVMSSYSPALEDLRESLEMIAAGRFKVEALKPKTFALEAFDEAARKVRERQVMKAVLDPSLKNGSKK